MANPEILVISILRALTEVALLSLAGQGAVALLAGSRRESNPIYQLFNVITRPAIRLTRFITPSLIIDKHVPIVAFFLMFWLWVLLAYVRRILCAADGASCLG